VPEGWRFGSPERFLEPLKRFWRQEKRGLGENPGQSDAEDPLSREAVFSGSSWEYFDRCSGDDGEEHEILFSQSGSWSWQAGEEAVRKYAVVVEEGCEASLEAQVQHIEHFQAHRLRVELRRGARVKCSLRLGECGTVLSVLEFILAEASSLELFIANGGVRACRLELAMRLSGEGSSATADLHYSGRHDHHFDCRTWQYHEARRTESRLRVKTALEDRARSIFGGKIAIAAAAAHSRAWQKNENLMLSREALAHSLPELDIRSKDVECSHGVTVVPLEAEVLFYLGSRGIGAAAARVLLRDAFLAWDEAPVPEDHRAA